MLEHKSGNISETRKDRGKGTMGGPIGTHQRSFEQYHPRPLFGLLFPKIGGSQPPPKILIAIIAGTGKATDFKFIFGETGAWAYPGTDKIFRVPPIISRTGKATNFKFCTHIHRSIGTKAHLKFRSRGRTQGLSKIFRVPIYRAHRTVIFAIAQLSCNAFGA